MSQAFSNAEPLRIVVKGGAQARAELLGERTAPSWLENQHCLPFSALSSDEFEILSYLLLLNENQTIQDQIYYYGKTGDSGRDIIINHSSGDVELIQCKHYSDNVGSGDIKRELAKVFVNIHRKKIFPKPTRISFFVTSDLTAPAIDMINDQAIWLGAMDEALEEFVKMTPTAELTSFAKSYWPTPTHVNGLRLTTRIKAFTSLIDEFFSIRKVVDAAGLAPINETLGLILNSLQPNPSMAPDLMKKLVIGIESDNPNFSISVTTTSQQSAYIIRPADPNSRIVIEPPTFPQTQLGEIGKEKFRQLIDEGRPVTLNPGEFSWESPIQSKFIEKPGPSTALSFKPNIKTERFPVLIEITDSELNVLIKTVTYFRLVRLGQKEIEFNISGGKLGASFEIVGHSERPEASTVSFSLMLPSVKALDAISTIDIFNYLQKEKCVNIYSIEGDKLFTMIGAELDTHGYEYKGERQFLDWISTINSSLSMDIRYPDLPPSKRDILTAELLAVGLTSGSVSVPPSYAGPMSMHMDKITAASLLSIWKTGNTVELMSSYELPFVICNTNIKIDNTTMAIRQSIPLIGVDEFNRQVAGMPEDTFLDVELEYSSIVFTFNK